jgi:hypothetical protein
MLPTTNESEHPECELSCGEAEAMIGGSLNPKRMWPTPRQCEAEGGVINNCQANESGFFRENKKGVRFGVKLKDAVNMFPTPASRDWKGGRSFEALEKSGRNENNNLCDKVNHIEGKVQSLNPDWVETLMGWPVGASSLEPMTELDWDYDWEYWEQDIPRVKPKEKGHANRLMAIGNGQVSLCMATAFEILKI